MSDETNEKTELDFLEETKMDEQIKAQMGQNFANLHRQFDDAAARANNNSVFIQQQSQELFLHTKQLVGATAQNLMEKNGLADSILQQRSARDQPGVA